MNQPNDSVITASRSTWREDLRLALLLGVAGGLATAALIPYLKLLMPEMMAKVPVSMAVLVAAQSVQGFLMFGLLAFLGLLMGRSIGIGAPWLRALLARQPRTAQPWLLAAGCGALAALVVVGLDMAFAPHMPAASQPLPAGGQGHAFVGFLASFYGGIGEEILMRLFCLTLIAWGLSLFTAGRARRWHFQLAIVAAALAFGALHLPTAAHFWPLDSVVIARTVLLNGIAGLVFGWFYVRNGLESAMLSHFAADLVLHVFTPLVAA